MDPGRDNSGVPGNLVQRHQLVVAAGRENCQRSVFQAEEDDETNIDQRDPGTVRNDTMGEMSINTSRNALPSVSCQDTV